MQRRTYVGLVLSAAVAGCTERASQSAETDGQDDQSPQQRYTTESGLELSVPRSETALEVTLDEDVPLIAKDEQRIVLVRVVGDNPTERAIELPTPDQFTVAVGEETRDPYQVTFQDDPNGLASTISSPVNGPLFPPSETLAAGSQTAGWVIFGAPTDATAATVQLRTSDGSVSKEWPVSVEGEK